MYYTIYKTTNKINGKIYIGKHQTRVLNDGYMGSGKYLLRSIEKHGIDNFKKEILHVFDNEDDMNAKEAEIVSKEFVKEHSNYNLCPGGNGGFGYLNDQYWVGEKRRKHNASISGLKNLDRSQYDYKSFSKKGNEKRSKLVKEGLLDPATFRGKTHSQETKRKIGLANKRQSSGSKNSQFGTMWITNGIENKKIKKIDSIPEGWYKGRKIKHASGRARADE